MEMPKKIKKQPLVFFGTAEFAVPILEALVKEGWPVSLVVTQPDEPAGRHQEMQAPPIKITAQKMDLKVAQPTKLTNDFIDSTLELKQVGLFIVCAYGRFLPESLLKLPPHGAINIHPSLLPKYRGPSPIQTAILHGDKTTGVSTMLLDAEMDHGPLLGQKKVEIGLEETAPELSLRLAKLGAQMLTEILPDFLAGTITPTPQNHEFVTLCKILQREDGEINWSRSTLEIYNQWRALQPWPGVFSVLDIQSKRIRVKLVRLHLTEKNTPANKNPGELVADGKALGIACGDRKILLIEELQPEGKKSMSGEAFVNGYLK